MKADTKVFFFPFLFPKSLLPEFAPKVWKRFDPLQVIFFWWQILYLKHQALLSQLPMQRRTTSRLKLLPSQKQQTSLRFCLSGHIREVRRKRRPATTASGIILRGQTTTTMARVLAPFISCLMAVAIPGMLFCPLIFFLCL